MTVGGKSNKKASSSHKVGELTSTIKEDLQGSEMNDDDKSRDSKGRKVDSTNRSKIT